MARLGLGERWKCVLANEWDPKKAAVYREKFGFGPAKECQELHVADVATITTFQVPGTPDLAWASFPCQDLSLAGAGAGLDGHRSGTFHPFWNLIKALASEGRAPKTIVLENVVGLLSSHEGRDFEYILSELVSAGYATGAIVMDAIEFLPQSRPRLFIVATSARKHAVSELGSTHPSVDWHPANLRRAYAALPAHVQERWVWWRLPRPRYSDTKLAELLDGDDSRAAWHSPMETKRLISMMSDRNRTKLREAMASGKRHVGAVYRRTRPDGNGGRTQRAEVRFDGISGCLRTPAGGSSRQIILVVEGTKVRSRLITASEAARLMGVDPDTYPIPKRYNDAYHLFGDGLVVPAVAHLANHLLLPLARAAEASRAA